MLTPTERNRRKRNREKAARYRKRQKSDVLVMTVAVPVDYLLSLVDRGYLAEDQLRDKAAVVTAIEASFRFASPEFKKFAPLVTRLRNGLRRGDRIEP